MCGGRPVVVVGGGNSAGQAAVFLARHVSRVELVVRGRDLGAAATLDVAAMFVFMSPPRWAKAPRRSCWRIDTSRC
jgi:cation diffusion facilitator CzcD-associated flavoprotein CzcO